MSENASTSSTTPSTASASTTKPPSPPKPQNPVFKMMGIPNFRFRLPSRNWMIFLSITGGFATAITYDRRQKKRIQQKWADLVAHISKETLPIEQNRRKLTVFLSAPPGDGLRSAREYFIEYVKPILVSAALDYEVIEGRKEGEVRAGLAEKIRDYRRQAGEKSSVVKEPSKELIIAETRRRMGITEEPGPLGDVVIGRHTWKEYIRGLHEGWLGPLDPPPPPPELPTEAPDADTASNVSANTLSTANSENTDSASASTPEQKPSTEPEKEKPKGPTSAYISTADYSSRNLPVTIPASFEASLPVPFPHLLGILNTPIRIYRYLTKRYLADAVGHEIAAAVLASTTRPYHEGTYTENSGSNLSNESFTSEPQVNQSQQTYEQQTILEHEEKEWHKSVRKAAEARKSQIEEENSASASNDTQTAAKSNLLKEEREWIDDVVIDPRIASRMSRYILAPEEEARAKRIDEGSEWVLGEGERPKKLPLWQRLWIDYGYGEDPEVAKRKPIYGNLDNENGE
ncbi:TIM complex componenet Tim54 [Talaromyces stipitatus ATCC 10500]|uniref:Mitochondrial import inner membrane translocase subunit TIM54 n=1 Tax=Talaromyces stipitatus (strain ATCC 10500 / CBS 375.48 / QM 6759 / NRRL 1006) TaxID=441959 RepID=B8LWD6_TALSN|nr:TIM complex component Tim54 [Talaromyces stipitatus ATCC 10500]EED24247.1 TIM complex componenet Tim54 [Talaromyces stipitatus ATCC 10500]